MTINKPWSLLLIQAEVLHYRNWWQSNVVEKRQGCMVFSNYGCTASTVSDSCEPQILRDNISFQTIEGKYIIIVEIYPGTNRPYYFKDVWKGKMEPIFVAGTSRQGWRKWKLKSWNWKEHILHGTNKFVLVIAKAEAIDKLCHDIHMYTWCLPWNCSRKKKNIPQDTEEHLQNFGSFWENG